MELKIEIITEFTSKELYPVVYSTRAVGTRYNYSATSTYVRNTRFVIEEILRDPYERRVFTDSEKRMFTEGHEGTKQY